MNFKRLVAGLIVSGMGLILVGCGSGSKLSRLPVSGTVSFHSGETLNGSISFIPAEGRSGPAATTAVVDGKYRFDATNGPTAGEHRVIVKRIVAKRTMLESRGGSQKADAKSVAPAIAKNEWTFSYNLNATDSGPRDFTLDSE